MTRFQLKSDTHSLQFNLWHSRDPALLHKSLRCCHPFIATKCPDALPDLLARTLLPKVHRGSLRDAPQVVRMKISGHKTDSMERRYNIVDVDDLSIAKEFMERRMNSA
jgi:hypothetical protein